MQATYAEFFGYVREDALTRGVITPYDIPDYEQYIPATPSTPFYSTNFGMNTPPQGFSQPQGYTQPQIYTQPQGFTQQEPQQSQNYTEPQVAPVPEAQPFENMPEANTPENTEPGSTPESNE
jgi:hypothetical protein